MHAQEQENNRDFKLRSVVMVIKVELQKIDDYGALVLFSISDSHVLQDFLKPIDLEILA